MRVIAGERAVRPVEGVGEVENWDLHVLEGEGGVHLRARHVLPAPGPQPRVALLLHGANSSSDTFVTPGGGLAAYLRDAGWDVWMLDWRGSPYTMQELLERPLQTQSQVLEERRRFTYDHVADVDLPLGLSFVRERLGLPAQYPISVMAHCVCGGVASIAIARRRLIGVTNVVLVALGLFYEVPWDGWIKVEDYILERILRDPLLHRAVNPHDPSQWPDVLKEAHERWPKAWVRDGGVEVFEAISFMFGQPWTPERLDSRIRPDSLASMFGPMHLGLYLHSGQMVRRGFAAPFDALDIVDPPRLRGKEGRASGRPAIETYLDPEPFQEKVITLISAAENRVWHRDSLDRMYDWLCNARPVEARRHRKHVFQGFGLQDLFWGKGAERVWKEIEEGLRRVP